MVIVGFSGPPRVPLRSLSHQLWPQPSPLLPFEQKQRLVQTENGSGERKKTQQQTSGSWLLLGAGSVTKGIKIMTEMCGEQLMPWAAPWEVWPWVVLKMDNALGLTHRGDAEGEVELDFRSVFDIPISRPGK